MEQERSNEKRELAEERDREFIRLQKEIEELRAGLQTRIKGYPTPRQHPIEADPNIKELVEREDFVALEPQEIDDPNRPQTKVLLITAHRSGSTFLGELFNQNEKAFYLFEPLVAIQSKMSTMGCDENSERKIK